MSHSITIQLSETIFEQLERAAELAQKPLDLIVESSLAQTLAPLVQDIPSEYQADVYPLLEMTEAELRREALSRFPVDRWAEYEQLLDLRRARELTVREATHLEQLKRQADVLTFRKGYAAILLKQRGYHAPTLQELNKSQ